MKRAIVTNVTVVLLFMVGTLVFSFNKAGKKDQFKEYYLAYVNAVDNTHQVIESRGDTVRALKSLSVAAGNLRGYDTFMENESVNGWPGFPSNPWCTLEAVYQFWRCTHELGEDYLYCMGVYDYSMRKCRGE